ncbi:hypothetical protein RclHR1_00030067 [Rhizophagus clarus]|uniref:F-box domain-containing protein n=1 Tax=Rhizophagus clarus TaxID=94130 RepID=A0A2Z6R5Y6_9GLOM|nr:hypothetical protein RclHR1_00030067 [Rhizophagus clarus]GES95580.1 hypothetical protein GLOIN_2v1474929 [Rhizophagus clarus]
MLLLNFFKKKQKKKLILPSELIRQIVLHLKDDKKSLHSCLLVSRDWCRETVILLWRQPFHFLYTHNKINTSFFSRFKNPNNQCLCCSEEKRQYHAINLLKTYLLIKNDKEFVEKGIIKAENERITFNYFEFLCTLDLHELYCAIKDWNQWNKSNSKSDEGSNYSRLTFGSMIRYFFTNMPPKLEKLSLDTKFITYEINNTNFCSFLTEVDEYEDEEGIEYDYYDDYDDDDSYYYCYTWFNNCILEVLTKELQIPKNNQLFDNLTELVLTISENKRRLYFYLSQVCHNIQKLIIGGNFPGRYDDDAVIRQITLESKQLAALIRSQYNLVYLEIFGAPGMNIYEIFKCFDSQSNPLKTLIINNANISISISIILSSLKHLQNLQELRFNKCSCIRLMMYGIGIFNFKDNIYEEGLLLPNLKYLQVNCLDENEVIFKELCLRIAYILIRCSPSLDRSNIRFI